MMPDWLAGRLWMIFAFIPYLSGIAWAFVGWRARERGWQLVGGFMLALLPLAMALNGTKSHGVDPFDFVFGMILLGWVGSCVAVFPLCSAYEKRMAQRGTPVAGRIPHPKSPRQPPAAAAAKPIDLNHASAEELASLPGLSPSLAERAFGYREGRGGFADLADFGRVVDLQPHQIEKFRARIVIGAPQPEAKPGDERGRLLDL